MKSIIKSEPRRAEAQRIGGLIRCARKAHSFTQEQVAQALRMSRTSIASIELGVWLPSDALLQRFSALLQVDLGVDPAAHDIVASGPRTGAKHAYALTPLGRRLHELRLERNLTLDNIADRLGTKTSAALSNYELGKHIPSSRTLEKLAAIFEIPAQELHALKFVTIAWPYIIADGILRGQRARIIDAPRKVYKPHPLDYPDPVWCQFEQMPTQWFPKGRLQLIAEARSTSSEEK